MSQTDASRKAQANWRKNNPEKRREYNRKQYLKGKDYRRSAAAKSSAKNRYGLLLEEYREIVKNPCEICGKEGPNVLDHSIQGSYHGVLCHGCNIGLGQLGHDAGRFRRAAEYLERTRGGDRERDGADTVSHRGEVASGND